MRCIHWTDPKGFKHASMVRDGDSDALAHFGLPCDPPDLNQLNWEDIKKELHNLLIDRDLLTWADVQRQQTGISGALNTVLRPRIIALYRTSPNGGDLKEAP
jgi:hypothetical protein